MKPIIYLKSCLLILACALMVISCSKSKTTTSASINGSWVTASWGGANDTAIILISTAAGTGTMTHLSPGAIAATAFSVNEVIFSNISSSSNGTYTALGEYRYGIGSQTIGHATATMALQNNNSVLYVHYAKDPASGITPPDYYWQLATK